MRRGKVKVYVCGVTPYDTTHLGHAFTYVFFDTLIRYLSSTGLDVIYTQNVTDIDDDVLRKSKEKGRDWKEFGEFWTKRYLTDMKNLNVSKPTHYVKATDSIDQILKIVGELVDRKLAYESGGNVYFDVRKFRGYGALSHFSPDQMTLLLKERGGNPNDPNKRYKLDFILWQKWKAAEPYWDSPWGRGRPGWHIECSAMVSQYLGDQIDIHGGGRDLIFPHHESEIAQSESFTGKAPFSKFFVHTAMVMNMGEKMSKSLGNLVLVSDLLKDYSPNAIRWMLLSHHYRQVWEYKKIELDDASIYARRLEMLLKKSGKQKKSESEVALDKFTNAMDDDLDTPKALGILKVLIEEGKDIKMIKYISGVLGFFV